MDNEQEELNEAISVYLDRLGIPLPHQKETEVDAGERISKTGTIDEMIADLKAHGIKVEDNRLKEGEENYVRS